METKNKYCSIPLLVFGVLNFISIALGNFFLGIAMVGFIFYLFKKEYNTTIIDTKYFYAILLFSATMLLSALFSGDVILGIKEWKELALYRIMPFFIVTMAINNILETKKILASSIIGITITSLYIIYQGINGVSRPGALYNNAMVFAGLFCIYLPIILICFMDERVFKNKRWLLGISFLICLLGLAFNATRGAWLALAPIMLFIVGYYIFNKNKIAIVCLIMFLAIGASLSQYKPFVARLSTVTNTNVLYSSNIERVLVWKSAGNMFIDHPVLGVGLGQYIDNYQHKYILPEAKEKHLRHAHNNFMQMLAENGIIGFIGFCGLIVCFVGYSFVRFWKQRDPYTLMMTMSALALFLQGLTEYNFGGSAIMKNFWLMQGCLYILSNSLDKDKKLIENDIVDSIDMSK